MANDVLFKRFSGLLSSKSTGEVDLGCPIPSPALLLSTNTFSDTWWPRLGGESAWRSRWNRCDPGVTQNARRDVTTILGNGFTGPSVTAIQRLAECTSLCALMDAMHAANVADLPGVTRTADLDNMVAIDTPLAEALAVRKQGAPSTPCHEVVVSSVDHEIKSVTRYPASECYCYAHAGYVDYSYVAVGGVCVIVTTRMGDSFHPLVPGKLVIFEAEWMGPWTAILCIIGAANTMLMAVFLAATPWVQGLTIRNPAFWFLAVNVAMEVVAIRMGWRLKHRWAMGWRRNLVRSDPFHALLTAHRADAAKVEWILGLEAMGGLASVVGIAFTSGVPIEALSAVAIPVLTSGLASCLSKSDGFRTPLVVGAMAFYLLEFVYEIVVLARLDDSVLGWVVILSCIAESISLVWIIATVLYALHFLSMTENKQDIVNHRAPARIRDGTLAAFGLPDLPSCGLMGTSALGSAVLARGSFIPNGGSAIKAGSSSYRACHSAPMTKPAGWLSLESCEKTSLTVVD